MPRLLPRLGLLALLILALGRVALGAPSPAAAVDCAKPLPAAAMARADAVFTGTVTASTAGAKAGFVSTVAVDRIYKGSVPAASVQVATAGGACGLGALAVGQVYVVMVAEAGGQFVAAGDSGTAPAGQELMNRVTAVLGDGTPYGATAAPVEVQFTQVGDSEPTPLLRAAAPGLALALAGFLGWLFVRRFS